MVGFILVVVDTGGGIESCDGMHSGGGIHSGGGMHDGNGIHSGGDMHSIYILLYLKSESL